MRNLKDLPIECGKGWHELIADCMLGLSEGADILQIKEKFGTLRVYITDGTDEDYLLIEKAEKKSSTICEICGQPGSTCYAWGWIKTMCPLCKEEAEDGRD